MAETVDIPRRPADPAASLGVFKRLDDVPDRYRLHHHADRYEGRDVWAEYVEETRLFERYTSETYRRKATRSSRSWKTHMDERGRHHALATPEDVEAYFADLLADRAMLTVRDYFHPVSDLYEWLLWHVDHPHRYNPIVMAAAAGGAAGEVWAAKFRMDRSGGDGA